MHENCVMFKGLWDHFSFAEKNVAYIQKRVRVSKFKLKNKYKFLVIGDNK